jgi:hypothetical protein
MAAAPPALYLPVTVDLLPYGKLSICAQPNAPLLMVFGGIDVPEAVLDPLDVAHAKQMVQSGDYMWPYLRNLRSRFHIFVGQNPGVDGAGAYRTVVRTLQWKGFPPSSCSLEEPQPFSGDQVLYLFSGGYRPGAQLLKKYTTKLFSTILLVDIWMKDGGVAKYYTDLAGANVSKTYYVHTTHGAVNDDARDIMDRKLRSQSILVKWRNGELGLQTHMRTNEEAVKLL